MLPRLLRYYREPGHTCECYPGYSGTTVNLATCVNATPATQVLQWTWPNVWMLPRLLRYHSEPGHTCECYPGYSGTTVSRATHANATPATQVPQWTWPHVWMLPRLLRYHKWTWESNATRATQVLDYSEPGQWPHLQMLSRLPRYYNRLQGIDSWRAGTINRVIVMARQATYK